MARSKEYQAAYDEMEALLLRETLARERKNKNRAIAHVLKERWPTALKDVPKVAAEPKWCSWPTYCPYKTHHEKDPQ